MAVETGRACSSMTDPEQEPRETPLPPHAEIGPDIARPPDDTTPYAVGFRPPPTTADRAFPAWSVWDLAVVVAFAGSAWIVLSSVALEVAHLATGKHNLPVKELAASPLVALGAQCVTEFAILIFMIAWLGFRSQEGFWAAIHWNWRGSRVLGLLLGGFVLALVVDFAESYLPIPKSLPIEKVFSEAAAAYLMSALGVVLAPLLEEVFFRGLLYPLMRRTVGVAAAVLFTATTFAFIHGAQLGFAWAPLLSIFVVGVVFTLVREKTESVAASFLMHCGYNLTLFGMLWIASDHFRHLEKVVN